MERVLWEGGRGRGAGAPESSEEALPGCGSCQGKPKWLKLSGFEAKGPLILGTPYLSGSKLSHLQVQEGPI